MRFLLWKSSWFFLWYLLNIQPDRSQRIFGVQGPAGPVVCDAVKISAERDVVVLFEGRSSRHTDLMEDGAIRQQIGRVRDTERSRRTGLLKQRYSRSIHYKHSSGLSPGENIPAEGIFSYRSVGAETLRPSGSFHKCSSSNSH